MNNLLLLLLFLFCSCSLQSKVLNSDEDKALIIAEKNNARLYSINQILIVFSDNSETASAVLVALEKTGGKWKVKFKPMIAGIGRNGFASPGNKYEGDGKTPTGVFRLGQLFCYEHNVNTQLPFIKTTIEDKWIDDPESEDYNKHIRGNTRAKSYENLLLSSDAYKYCMVIEYNTYPVIKGKGSAIFFHLGKNPPGSTAGCVAIKEDDMKLILSWLHLKQKPSIVMGTLDLLISVL